MLRIDIVAMAKLRKEIGAVKEKGENFGVRGEKKEKPPMRRAREAWIVLSHVYVFRMKTF